MKAKPASLVNIAFDTGAISERERCLNALRKELGYAEPDTSFYRGIAHAIDVLEELCDHPTTRNLDCADCDACQLTVCTECGGDVK